jgi:hypothetical protein
MPVEEEEEQDEELNNRWVTLEFKLAFVRIQHMHKFKKVC